MWLTLIEHQHSCQTALLSFLICTNLVFSDLPSLSWFILNLGLHSKDLQFPGHSQNNFESSVFLIFKIVYSFEKCQYQECIKKSGGISKGNIESFMCTFFTTHSVNREAFWFFWKKPEICMSWLFPFPALNT